MAALPGLPSEIDVTTPSPARIYDYILGGKDNYAADRAAADKALSVVPDGKRIAWANRRFLIRAVKYLAHQGIGQFIDLGTGIPTSPNVHETAKAINPSACVAYIDNDPVVTVHNMALLESVGNGIAAIRGDIRHPASILRNPALRDVIDFRQPVGLLFAAVLHFITDNQGPYRAVAAFRDQVPAGSGIVVSHITSDSTDPHVLATIQDTYRHASAPAVFRTQAQIQRFFDGFALAKPGLVEVSQWRGNNHKTLNRPALGFLAGVGRKM